MEVSEFHLVKSGITDQDAVQLDDLAKTLGKKGHHAELSKKLNAEKIKAKVLPKPLEKPAAERVHILFIFDQASYLQLIIENTVLDQTHARF